MILGSISLNGIFLYIYLHVFLQNKTLNIFFQFDQNLPFKICENKEKESFWFKKSEILITDTGDISFRHSYFIIYVRGNYLT